MSSTPVSTGNGCWDVKKILGEAKVYEDGSAMFNVPAHTPVYFQAIDKNGSMVQTMRSWSTLMPNETAGCVGCHEDKRNTPLANHNTLAMKSGPQELAPFFGPPRGFSFVKEVQPILDRACVECHDGEQTDPNTGEMLVDLSSTRFEDKTSKRMWTHSYLNLTHSGYKQRARGDADHEMLNWVSSQSVPTMLPPYYRGSAKSEIMTMLRDGHGRTNLPPEDLAKFAAWIDLSVPFSGDYIEGNAWNERELEKYILFQRKRERLANEVRKNTEAWIEQQTGTRYRLPVAAPRHPEYDMEP
jgi:cytochrome c553